MAKCYWNDVGSLVLDRPSGAAHHSRLWTAFSGCAFRQKIVNAVSCGASSRHRQQIMREVESDEVVVVSSATASRTTATTIKSVLEHSNEKKSERVKAKAEKTNVKSDKLLDLLNLAEADAETRKKVEVLEKFKLVVKKLQVEDEGTRRATASRARLLAKEDSEARVTLVMLGAIPPLVGMLNFEDADSQIAALYALLIFFPIEQ